MDSISLSYAKAIYELQKENYAFNYLNELELINKSFDKDIKKFLLSKAISANDKKDIINKTLNKFDKNIVSFICVLIDNNRIDKLDDIIETFKILLQDEQGIVLVNVRLNKELNAKEKEDLKQAIKNKFNKEFNLENKIVEINEIIDKSIIQGLVIEYKGKVYNASLLNKQVSLKEYLEK